MLALGAGCALDSAPATATAPAPPATSSTPALPAASPMPAVAWSADALQAFFEDPDRGFDFTGAPVGGDAVASGRTANELAWVEFLGDGQELREVRLTITIPKDNSLAQATIDQNLAHLRSLLTALAPEWPGSQQWLLHSIAPSTTGAVSLDQSRYTFTLVSDVEGGTIRLTAAPSTAAE
jgi:hypothetical protein